MLIYIINKVGFVHGVLNTDNMSVLGLTIDYGPYKFIDHFNKKTISNYSDKEGLYSYDRQPETCKWNLFRFAEDLAPWVNLLKSTNYILEEYDKIY